MHKECDDMPQILKKRITVNSHKGYHCQREQCYRHNDNPDCSRHRNPHQLRIAYQNHKENSFDGIASLHHAAEEFSRIRVIGRDRVNVAVFLFFHRDTLQQILRNNGNVQNVARGDIRDLLILISDHKEIIRQRIVETLDQLRAEFFFFYVFGNGHGLAVDEMDALIGCKHFLTFNS